METKAAINIQEQVNKLVEDQELSPYKASEVASEVLGRYLREQMVYNYCKKSYIPSHKDEAGKLKISKADLISWLEKFYQKNVAPKD